MGYTYQCWQCGKRVDQDDVSRATVTAGRGPWRVSTRRINLCPVCAAARRRRSRAGNLVLLAVIAALAIYMVDLHYATTGSAHTTTSTATSPATGYRCR
jgi:hypothetical protein